MIVSFFDHIYANELGIFAIKKKFNKAKKPKFSELLCVNGVTLNEVFMYRPGNLLNFNLASSIDTLKQVKDL